MLLDFSWSNSASRSITKSTRRSQVTGMDAVVFPLVSKRNQPYPRFVARMRKSVVWEEPKGTLRKNRPTSWDDNFQTREGRATGHLRKWRVYGLCPFFARYAYRALILPRRPAASLTQTKRHKQPQPATRVQFRLGGVLQHSNTPSLRATGFEDEDEAPGERAHSQRP
jgi:hypothetical protein